MKTDLRCCEARSLRDHEHPVERQNRSVGHGRVCLADALGVLGDEPVRIRGTEGNEECQ